MPIYRVQEPRSGELHIREWRRRLLHTVLLLLATLLLCAIGLIALDTSSDIRLPAKMFRGIWNALNLVTTLGAFSNLDPRQKFFMMGTMVVFLVTGGYAISSLSGFLSSEPVMVRRENRVMKSTLERLVNHVIVIGFGPLGRLVANRLRDAGEQVVVIDRSDDLVAQASSQGHLVVQGEAGVDDAVLDHARIAQAKSLVVSTEDADRKLSITLMAHSRNPALKIAVTGMNGPRAEMLRRAGATEVVVVDDLIAATLVERLGKAAKD
jgi:voltage-gated potassium channel